MIFGNKMDKDALIKIRAWCLYVSTIVLYPVVLVLSTMFMLLKRIFGNQKYKNIAGDVALVTGGGHGLGKSLAIELAKYGCHIAVADINFEGAKETVNLIMENYNVKAKAYKIDISNYDAVNVLNEEITKDLGAATILINNAGLLLLSNPLKPNWQEVQRMINVNLTAHFWTNQIFRENMKAKKRGHIVAISSAAGLIPLPFASTYTSTKFAVRGMMRTLRTELQVNRFMHGEEIYATTVFPVFLETNEKVTKLVKRNGVNNLYPLIAAEDAAARIVTGMLRNEEEIVLPSFMGILHKTLETLPSFCQDLILFTQAYLTAKGIEKSENS